MIFPKKIHPFEEVSMKITLSILKADIGSIGGHITPSQALFDEVKNFVKENGKNLLIDFLILREIRYCRGFLV